MAWCGPIPQFPHLSFKVNCDFGRAGLHVVAIRWAAPLSPKAIKDYKHLISNTMINIQLKVGQLNILCALESVTISRSDGKPVSVSEKPKSASEKPKGKTHQEHDSILDELFDLVKSAKLSEFAL